MQGVVDSDFPYTGIHINCRTQEQKQKCNLGWP